MAEHYYPMAYLRFTEGKVARTVEWIEGGVIADFDGAGNLLGIDILMPFDIKRYRSRPTTDKATPDARSQEDGPSGDPAI
jgi:uncharacterized protein YuzE